MERFQKVTLTLLVLILFGCANQLPPTGGEEDKIPPEILEIYPAAGTTNYENNYFEVTFSEYVNKRSAVEAVFISPYIEGDIDYSWSGRTLEVSFPDSMMKENVTYTVTIGTDVKDINNNNRMAESAVFAFSTGDKIDNNQIYGQVYDKNPEGVMITAYRIDEDTLNPKTDKPDYVSQTGNKGEFRFLGLADGTYRLFAIRDEFKDLLYKVEQDAYGAPLDDIMLNSADSVYYDLKFRLTKEDSTLPALMDAIMVDSTHLFVEFSEFIDSSRISTDNFTIVDSATGQVYPVEYLYKGQAGPMKMFIAFDDKLDPESQIYITYKDVYDLAGNKSEPGSFQLTVNEDPDTVKPAVIKVVTKYPKATVDYDDPVIDLLFSDGISSNSVNNLIKITDVKERVIGFNTKFTDDGTLRIIPGAGLKQGEVYKLFIKTDEISDISGNIGDSSYTTQFRVIDELEFSGAQGQVIAEVADEFNVILESVDQNGETYNGSTKSGEFYFDKVLPGQYVIWAYKDANDNNLYDAGSIDPFKYSEDFSAYPDTIDLKARWPVGDIIIKF